MNISIYSYYATLLIFLVVVYVITQDQLLAARIDLNFRAFMLNLQKLWLMIKLHPRNFITNWQFERKYRNRNKK